MENQEINNTLIYKKSQKDLVDILTKLLSDLSDNGLRILIIKFGDIDSYKIRFMSRDLLIKIIETSKRLITNRV